LVLNHICDKNWRDPGLSIEVLQLPKLPIPEIKVDRRVKIPSGKDLRQREPFMGRGSLSDYDTLQLVVPNKRITEQLTQTVKTFLSLSNHTVKRGSALFEMRPGEP
jgi:hypothetical protein